MKTLIILITILTLVSCEQGGESGSSSAGSSSPKNVSDVVQNEPSVVLDIQDGTYKTACFLEGGETVYYTIQISNYELTFSKTVATNSNCNEGIKSILSSKYDVVGNELEYDVTNYYYLSVSGGDYICNESGQLSGNTYDVSNVNCSDVNNHKNYEVTQDSNGDWLINGKTFTL